MVIDYINDLMIIDCIIYKLIVIDYIENEMVIYLKK